MGRAGLEGCLCLIDGLVGDFGYGHTADFAHGLFGNFCFGCVAGFVVAGFLHGLVSILCFGSFLHQVRTSLCHEYGKICMFVWNKVYDQCCSSTFLREIGRSVLL